MLYKKFVKTLEWFVTPNENNLTNYIHDRTLLTCTIRLTLHNPEFIQQYLDSLPKVTID